MATATVKATYSLDPGTICRLEEIARQAAMSTRTLNRRFREQTGYAPLQWLLRARVRRAQALAAWWHFRLGHRDAAREAANPLVDAYNDATEAEGGGARAAARTAVLRDAEFLTYVGLAARALGATRNANDAFNQALRVEPARVETNLEQAELMLTTEDYGPAGEALRAALAANPHSARGLALRARARLLSNLDFTRAGDDLAAAEAVNPRLPAVSALRAAIALRDGLIAEADRHLDGGAAINPRDLDVLTMRGVVRFFADGAATGGRVRMLANGGGWDVDVGWLTGEVRVSRVRAP